jgi:hypothetical protein
MSNLQTNEQNSQERIIIIDRDVRKKNGMGTAGFVLALLGVLFGWVPALGWILWLLGLIFSIIGITRTPKGLAIAGLVLSLIGIIVIIVFVVAFGSLLEDYFLYL